jgi:hypothetical protein
MSVTASNQQKACTYKQKEKRNEITFHQFAVELLLRDRDGLLSLSLSIY